VLNIKSEKVNDVQAWFAYPFSIVISGHWSFNATW